MAEGILVPPRMSGEPVTQAQFFQALTDLREHIDEKHTSLRFYIGERAGQLEDKLEKHAAEDRLIADRVLVLETKRGSDGLWGGGIAGLVITIGGWAIQKLWH